jgi:V8-like Glu-specific endopeptidase
MHLSESRATIILAALAALTTAFVMPEASGKTAEREVITSHVFTETGLRRALTKARMKAALPMPYAIANTFGVRDERIRHSAVRPTLSSQAATGSYTRNEIADPTQAPYRTQGKLFLFDDGLAAPSFCSATALNSANGSVVFTAGHCLYDHEYGLGWIDGVVFVPGYRFGNAPYGEWVAESGVVASGWITDENPRRDFAALVMSPHDGVPIVDRIGGRDFIWNQPRAQAFESFGYPVDPPFDGERLYVCRANTAYYDGLATGEGPYPMGIGCDMTAGSSGGGWIINGSHLNSVNSYGYDGYEVMFGPYLDGVAAALYQEASAVTVSGNSPAQPAAPSSSPTVSASPTPSSTPTAIPTPTPTPSPTKLPSTTSTSDGNDTRSQFDLQQVVVSEQDEIITVKVRTHDKWAARLLSREFPRNYIFIDFDTFGNYRSDYFLSIWQSEGSIVAELYDYEPSGNVLLGVSVVDRPTRRDLTVAFPSDLFDTTGKQRWFASSQFKGRNGCVKPCWDYAPNRGMVSF